MRFFYVKKMHQKCTELTDKQKNKETASLSPTQILLFFIRNLLSSYSYEFCLCVNNHVKIHQSAIQKYTTLESAKIQKGCLHRILIILTPWRLRLSHPICRHGWEGSDGWGQSGTWRGDYLHSYGTLRKTYHEDLKMVYFSVAMAVYFWMAIYNIPPKK